MESSQLIIKKHTEWEDCRKSKDLLKLFEILDTFYEDENTGTNKDDTYVNLLQPCKFYNFM